MNNTVYLIGIILELSSLPSTDLSPASNPAIRHLNRVQVLETSITELVAGLTAVKYRCLMLVREFH